MNVVQQHTRSHVLVDRNGMVSTAAGAGPGAIAGFDPENSDDPYLANPLRLPEVVVINRNRTRQAVRTAHLLSAPPTSHKQPLTGYAWDPSIITPVATPTLLYWASGGAPQVTPRPRKRPKTPHPPKGNLSETHAPHQGGTLATNAERPGWGPTVGVVRVAA
jgi:hypothetical protein